MKHQLVSVVALIDSDSRILISKRPASKKLSGYWEFPGGKVEADESPYNAAVRELKEELDIKTWSNCLTPLTFTCHVYDNVNHIVLLFVCRKWEGFPLAHESNELKWVRSNELNQFKMLPANHGMMAILRDWL